MKKSKILALMVAVALCVATCAFVACDNGGSAEAASVMTVELNPEVEFVLDSDNKVLAVNALNEEGNLVISADAFKNVEGKSAEDAAKLFVQVSVETGYLVSGSVSSGENEIEFSFSGDTAAATELYGKVKTNVQNYLSDAKVQVNATLEQSKAIARDELEEEVAECRPDLTESQIQAMTEKQLLAEILQSRKATADMYSQELKDAYYEAKAYAMEQAKLEVVKGKLTESQQNTLEIANKTYTSAIDTLESVRKKNLIDEDSAYQKALANVRSAKTDYLKMRNEISQMEQSSVTEAETQRLAACQAALETAEEALVAAGNAANILIDSAKNLLEIAYKSVVSAISSVDVDAISAEISARQTEAINIFTTEFETTYKSAEQTAQNNWKKMMENLTAQD